MSDLTTSAPENSRLRLADGLGMALLCTALMVYSYRRGHNAMFWSDEIMGVLVLKQPTIGATLHAWRNGLDSSGLWFEILARGWAAVFGFSECSMRFFSAIGICAAACLIWLVTRRFYTTLVVAGAVSASFGTSLALTWQLVNGRTYGLFLAACAFCFYLLFRGQEHDTDRPKARFLLFTVSGYSFLMGSHILGVLYVSGFLATQLLLDLYYRRLRPRLYIAISASGVVLLFSSVNIRSTIALGKPTFWTLRPHLKDLLTVDHHLCGLILLTLLLVNFSFRLRPARKAVYLVFAGFGGLDLFIWCYSRVGTSIFENRYLLPFCLVAVLLLSELLTQLSEISFRLHFIQRALAVAFIVAGFAQIFVPAFNRPWWPIPNYTRPLLRAVPSGLAVISPDAGVFTEMEYYRHPGQARVLFPIDWPIALDRANHGGVSGMHEMENFKSEGFYPDDIQPTDALLTNSQDFLVLAEQQNLWFRKRVLSDPRFTVTSFQDASLSKAALPTSVWRVHAR